jgi:FAD synthetase
MQNCSMRVLVFGTFDRLHPGHEFVLREAAKRGDVFVVIARDANVERIKGKRPAESEDHRKDAVESFLPHATVILGDAKDFLKPVHQVKPDLILFGYDQRLPPGVSESDLPCPVERLPGFEPGRYKSSLILD